MLRVVVLVALIGCSADDPVAENSPDAQVGQADRELPPQGHSPLKAWLADGHYKSWACEEAPHPARPPGAHGTNRICSNAVLSSSLGGEYPVGAASVKELWQNGRVTGFAVGRKTTDGWYWYEAYGDNVIADGVHRALCDNCHAGAPRDNVFTHVR